MLAPGWRKVEANSSTSRPYYYHCETRKVQWEAPLEAIGTQEYQAVPDNFHARLLHEDGDTCSSSPPAKVRSRSRSRSRSPRLDSRDCSRDSHDIRVAAAPIHVAAAPVRVAAAPVVRDNHEAVVQDAQEVAAVDICSTWCRAFRSDGGSTDVHAVASALALCFSNDVRVSNLSSGAVVACGRKKVVAALLAGPKAQSRPAKTIRFDVAGSDASLILGFFAPGEAPGLNTLGIAKPGGGPCNSSPVALLMRTRERRIDHVWFASDSNGFCSSSGGKASLVALGLWADVMDVVKENLAPAAADSPTRNIVFQLDHFSSDEAGSGLGQTLETWTETVCRPGDHYFIHPKNDLV